MRFIPPPRVSDDFGRIVGIFIDDTDTWRGFVLVGNKFQAIEFPNAEYTTAVGINPLGIVGSTDGDGGARGYFLRNGRYWPIAYPGAYATTANRINYSGEIVGTWGPGPESARAYILTKRGFESFDFPGSTFTVGRDINDFGHVVGSYIDDAGNHGYLRIPRRGGHHR